MPASNMRMKDRKVSLSLNTAVRSSGAVIYSTWASEARVRGVGLAQKTSAEELTSARVRLAVVPLHARMELERVGQAVQRDLPEVAAELGWGFSSVSKHSRLVDVAADHLRGSILD